MERKTGMDTVLEKIERLADLASREPTPVTLDVESVMLNIRGLEIEEEPLPLKLFAGGALAAAVAAAFVFVVAAGAWMDLNSPYAAIDSLMDVMDILQ